MPVMSWNQFRAPVSNQFGYDCITAVEIGVKFRRIDVPGAYIIEIIGM
jgi:hypothetical protein